MAQSRYVFTQLCDLLPKRVFDCIVDKYEGNKWVKTFTCWHHLLVMLFAQLSGRESLRDLITTLDAHKSKFYRLGFGTSLSRSNLSKANEVRDVRIFQEFAERMIEIAKEKRFGIKDFFLANPVYAFDSSTISLCLSTFWWTKLHHGKGGIKVHTLYDVKTSIPTYLYISDANVSDPKVMHLIPYEENGIYIFDRAYMYSSELHRINRLGAYFVVREKHKILYDVIEDKKYNNPTTGIMADQIIRLTGQTTRKDYPDNLRRVAYYDVENNRTFVFYTNNMNITAEDVAELYRNRWKVELFFKWMKQHLHIKEFFGTTENAVKIQIYTAVIAYCLVAVVERELKCDMEIYDVLRILGISLLDKTPIVDLLRASEDHIEEGACQQLWIQFEE